MKPNAVLKSAKVNFLWMASLPSTSAQPADSSGASVLSRSSCDSFSLLGELAYRHDSRITLLQVGESYK